MSVEPTSVADLRYECPVCMEPLFPPVFQCHNGHLLCQVCSFRLENCGVCRAVLPQVDKVRNLEVERIIRMIKHHCPNQIDGCLAEVNFDQVEAHRLECDYRKFPLCRDILGQNCEEMSIREFETHYVRVRRHNSRLLSGGNRGPPVLTLPVTQDLPTWLMDPSSSQRPVLKFYIEEKPTKKLLFLVVIRFDEATDLLTWKPYVLARKDVASQLNFKLSILSGQHVKFMLESTVFNVETEPEELLACPSLPLNFFRTNFVPQANEIGGHHFQFALSRKTETRPNEQADSVMEST